MGGATIVRDSGRRARGDVAAGREDPPPAIAEEARLALELARAEPQKAQRLAASALAGEADPGTRSAAEHALGLAAMELLDLDEAIRHLRAAVSIARRGDFPRVAAEARANLSYALLRRGDTQAALKEADRAVAALDGLDRARLETRRALVLQRLGRLDEARAVYDGALPLLQEAGDRLWEARLLCNRGILHAYRGDFAAADSDLVRAERLHQEGGQRLAAAQVRHNLGFVAARRGDVPAALAWYDAAEADLRALGVPIWVGLADRCDLLLSLRLLAEARAVAERAVAELQNAGMASDLAEARLALAQAALLEGDLSTARTAATRAREAFEDQGRQGWAALARHVALRADWEGGDRSAEMLEAARGAAADLADAGWAVAALDARLMAATTAVEQGRVPLARRELAASSSARRSGPADLRARAWHAEALLRLAEGNRRGADAALRAGMRAVRRHQATLGAAELRAHVSGHAGEVATLGLRLAVETGDPRRVLRWAERWRAGTLEKRAALPPDDTELVSELAELREVAAQINEAALAGGDTAGLLRRQAGLERAIQQRTRRVAGDGDDADPTLDIDALAHRLGDAALVEVVRLDDRLHAVVVAGGRARLRTLATISEVAAELESLRFGLRRLGSAHGTAASRDAAGIAVSHAAGRLDRMLLEPLRSCVADRPLVLVPTGKLHALPWGALPSCSGRAVTAAPSAAVWLRAATRAHRATSRAVLVAAPEPPHAAEEVAELKAHYPQAVTLTGTGARAAEVGGAIDGAGLAHLACHGRFRADNPLFSALTLADGPLTVYDLERLDRAPRLLVLSACDSGLSAVRPGDELMGLAAALLSVGTSALVASVVPVPDAATRTLMVSFHARLVAGSDPATALAGAQQELRSAGAAGIAAAGGFVVFGSGLQR